MSKKTKAAPGVSLLDQLSLVLLRLGAGGPVTLRAILKELEDRGVATSASTVVQALTRNQDRFVRTDRGLYGLNLGKGIE